MNRKKRSTLLGDVLGVFFAVVIFIVPFYFMLITALKSSKEANLLSIAFPSEIHWENFSEVFKTNNYMLLTAFKNSFLITIFSVVILIITGAMAGYVIQRRRDRMVGALQAIFLMGLMIPAAILPTISLLQKLHIYKTMFSMIMIEVALQLPFTIMLYRGFMASIPRELEEAARIDGCGKFQTFFQIILPLLKPITATVIILDAVTVFNDFTNPLYFFPGNENATVQLTLYNFKGQFSSSYNLMFADILIITIPMFILFLIFNKRIVAGMVAGSVKG
ncbi:MAG TPA: ABC transporter [Oribacterium sp.]|nr:ABC transporter [Oribacterium sp.]